MKNKHSRWFGMVLLSGFALNGSHPADAAPARSANRVQPKQQSRSNYAQNNRYLRRAETPWNEKSFYLFGGIDLGYASYSKSTLATDASRGGLAFGVRALAAYYAKKWVVDGGLGFHFISSSGTNTTNDQLKVSTRTLFIDLSPRYRIDRSWQIGPELQFWLGTDNGLNQNIFSTSVTNNAFLGGLQLIHEWQHDQDETKYRLGARWNTDLNVDVRNLNLFQVFFQIGFSPGGGGGNYDRYEERPRYTEELRESDLEQVEPETYQPAPVSTPEPLIVEPEPEVMSTPAPVATATPMLAGPQAKMVMTLDINSLPFESDSARLPKYHRDRVKEIGRFLGEQKDGWNRMVVSGHTDEQGQKAYNMKLSKARADTVRQLLGEGGAPISKIRTVGYGPTKPLDRSHTKAAWAKNRRVELEFFGVKDGLVIQKAFRSN